MVLKLSSEKIQEGFDLVKEKYGYDKGMVLTQVRYDDRVWQQNMDYRFAYDLFNAIFTGSSDGVDLIEDALKSYTFYYKNENIIFKRMLNYMGVLPKERISPAVKYMYELDAAEMEQRMEDFIEKYENLSQLKGTLDNFERDEFWVSKGVAGDLAYDLRFMKDILAPAISELREIMASDIYEYSMDDIKAAAYQVIDAQTQVREVYVSLYDYYKNTDVGKEEYSRCVLLQLNPLAELNALSASDFDLKDGKLEVVDNAYVYDACGAEFKTKTEERGR